MENPLVGLRVDGSVNVFLADSREECREAVVVVLAPLFEWMVVTPRALNSESQEELSGVFNLFVDLVHFAVPDDGGID